MLEINKTVSTNGISIFTSQITDSLSDLAPFFGANAETVINASQRRFRSPKRLAERLTIEAMICAVFGENTTLYHTADGKPYCDGTNQNISISHSKTHAALLVCNHPHCGVDIEQISPRILNLASRFVTDEEKPDDSTIFRDEIGCFNNENSSLSNKNGCLGDKISSLSNKNACFNEEIASLIGESYNFRDNHATFSDNRTSFLDDRATFSDDNERENDKHKWIGDQRQILWLTTLWTIKEAAYKSAENQSDIDILTDIRVPALQIDALIRGEAQQNTVYIGNNPKEKHDVISLLANDNILSYIAY